MTIIPAIVFEAHPAGFVGCFVQLHLFLSLALFHSLSLFVLFYLYILIANCRNAQNTIRTTTTQSHFACKAASYNVHENVRQSIRLAANAQGNVVANAAAAPFITSVRVLLPIIDVYAVRMFNPTKFFFILFTLENAPVLEYALDSATGAYKRHHRRQTLGSKCPTSSCKACPMSPAHCP